MPLAKHEDSTRGLSLSKNDHASGKTAPSFIWLKALALGLLRNALRYRLSKIGIDDNEAE